MEWPISASISLTSPSTSSSEPPLSAHTCNHVSEQHKIELGGACSYTYDNAYADVPDLLYDSLQTWRVEHFLLSLCSAEAACVPVLRWRVAPQCERYIPTLEIHTDVFTAGTRTCRPTPCHSVTLHTDLRSQCSTAHTTDRARTNSLFARLLSWQKGYTSLLFSPTHLPSGCVCRCSFACDGPSFSSLLLHHATAGAVREYSSVR